VLAISSTSLKPSFIEQTTSHHSSIALIGQPLKATVSFDLTRMGGHDHQPYLETVNGCVITKQGADATMIGVVDITWAGPGVHCPPRHRYAFRTLVS